MANPAVGIAPVAPVSPINVTVPNYALRSLQSQRQQQLAAALQQQGMAPIDYDPRGRISWTQGLAKVLQAGLGGYESNQAIGTQADLATQNALAVRSNYWPDTQSQPSSGPTGQPSPQSLAAALDPRASAALAQGAQQGSVGPTVANAARMDVMPPPPPPSATATATATAPPATGAPQQQPGGLRGPVAPMNPFGAPPIVAYMASQGDPAALEELKTYAANATLTPEQRNAQDPTIGASVRTNLQTQNMTPVQKLQAARAQVPDGSPQAAQLDAAIFHETYNAPIEVKAGNLTMTPDGRTPLAYNPGLDRGINPTWSTSPGGYTTATGAAPVAGYAPSAASIVAADQRARQDNTLTTVPDASGAQHTVWGNGQPFGAAPGTPGSSTATPQFNLQGTPAQQIGILSNIAANHADPMVRAAAGQRIAQIAGGGGAPAAPQSPAAPAQPTLGVGPDPTVQAGRTDLQGDLSKKWTDLNGQASQSQAVVNNLQQIKSLAANARTGAFTDKQQAADAILAMLGSQDAQQRQMANQLLGKNAAQITTRLGQGSLNTDAARALVYSAYPNAHMMGDAIAEASDNLVAQQRLTQAKAQLLGPYAMRNDPQGYQQAETTFNLAADPRIFQARAIADPAARKAYMSKIIAQDPSLAMKAQALESLGVQ